MTWLHRLWLRLEPVDERIKRESLERLNHPPRRTHLDAIGDLPGTSDAWESHLRDPYTPPRAR